MRKRCVRPGLSTRCDVFSPGEEGYAAMLVELRPANESCASLDCPAGLLPLRG
jgi:hypothetical protein